MSEFFAILWEAAIEAGAEAFSVSILNLLVGYWIAQQMHKRWVLKLQRRWKAKGQSDSVVAHKVTMIYTGVSVVRVFVITFFTLLSIKLGFGV